MFYFTYVLPFIFSTCSSLQDSFIEEVKVCVSRMGQNTSASQRRRRHAQLQERVQGLWDMLHLFEKAIGHFEGKFFFSVSHSYILAWTSGGGLTVPQSNCICTSYWRILQTYSTNCWKGECNKEYKNQDWATWCARESYSAMCYIDQIYSLRLKWRSLRTNLRPVCTWHLKLDWCGLIATALYA